MSKLYFIPGSQDLYGRECLDQVAADCRAMVDFLNEKLNGVVTVEVLGVFAVVADEELRASGVAACVCH